VNRGFYPNAFTWFSGSLTYTLGGANSSVSIAGSNHARATAGTAANRFYQNDEMLFNVVYTYNSPPWTVTPYVQYTNVPVNPSIGAFTSASTFGEAILINYSFGDGSVLTGFSLPLRLEYISSTGSLASGAPNLLYGPGSNDLVGDCDADLPIQDLLRAGRTLARRSQPHYHRIGLWLKRQQHDADPHSVRSRYSILN
jgi:Putative beta-barrel porin-2, OmpL-like. bbp2